METGPLDGCNNISSSSSSNVDFHWLGNTMISCSCEIIRDHYIILEHLVSVDHVYYIACNWSNVLYMHAYYYVNL